MGSLDGGGGGGVPLGVVIPGVVPLVGEDEGGALDGAGVPEPQPANNEVNKTTLSRSARVLIFFFIIFLLVMYFFIVY